MLRRARQTEPDRLSLRLGQTLYPLSVIPWGAMAMWHLGVPIAVEAPMIVVRDGDYMEALRRFEAAGFRPSAPNRAPPPEIGERHPNPEQMLAEINAGYKRLDRSCAVFNYSNNEPVDKGFQLYVFPDSFAHMFSLELSHSSVEKAKQFNIYGNLHFPPEPALVESFVRAAIDEEVESGFSSWGESLRAWVSLMTGYLEVNNDILDDCPDARAVEWYSSNFGRIYESKFGPIDRRITKRLGSGKEMPVDMRGNPV